MEFVLHACDTSSGASGSAILNANDEVVAVHALGTTNERLFDYLYDDDDAQDLLASLGMVNQTLDM